MRELGGFLGWVAVWGYAIALLGFFFKYINKKYINKLPKEKKQFAVAYRLVMKYILKFHKLAGVIASIVIVIHFYLMYSNFGMSISGLIAAIVMWIVFAIGIYGFAINKNLRGPWVKIHRILAIILIILIALHVFF